MQGIAACQIGHRRKRKDLFFIEKFAKMKAAVAAQERVI